MRWYVESGVFPKYNTDIITDLKLESVNIDLGTSVSLNIYAIELVNGILTFILKDVFIYMTSGTNPNWRLNLYAKFNFIDTWVLISHSEVTVSSISTEISYYGLNICMINLDWDGYIDVTLNENENKGSTLHIVNPGFVHGGTSKNKFKEFTGNEKNCNLNNQLI